MQEIVLLDKELERRRMQWNVKAKEGIWRCLTMVGQESKEDKS
jgi:hypothetical protein